MDPALDHVLVFVEDAAPPVAALESAGFRVLPREEHTGQGTANRSALFADSYLELAFLTSRKEAGPSPLRLEERADWRSTGASPFGFGLRADVTPLDKQSLRPYVAPYWNPAWPPLWFFPACLDDPTLPLLFVQEPWARRSLEDMRPERWNPHYAEFLRHGCGATRITGVEVESPHPPTAPPWRAMPRVSLRQGPREALTLTVDAPRAFTLEVLPHLTVRSAGQGPG
jgi:hypothetical protein